MTNYRRAFVPGGTWFFTVNLLERKDNDLLLRNIAILRQVVKQVQTKYPFKINAWVVLPEHLHAVLTLPDGDSNFSLRWRLIKSGFSRALPKVERLSPTRQTAGERGIWQRHYWEHCIRNEEDYRRHIDYVHINPLKHGWVSRVGDWPYSTFHRYVKAGIYSADWGCERVVIAGEEFGE